MFKCPHYSGALLSRYTDHKGSIGESCLGCPETCPHAQERSLPFTAEHVALLRVEGRKDEAKA